LAAIYVFSSFKILPLSNFLISRISSLVIMIFLTIRCRDTGADIEFLSLVISIVCTECVTRIRTNRIISLNKMFLIKKIKYYKKSFYMALGDLCRDTIIRYVPY